MIKRRIVLPVVATLIGAVLIGASLGFVATTEPTNDVGSNYTISDDAGIYSVTMERYKRHGPQTITRAPFQLENSTQVLRYTIEGDGSLTNVSHSIKSSDERNEYLLELEGTQYTVTDVTTGVESEGPRIPETSLPVTTQPLAPNTGTQFVPNTGVQSEGRNTPGTSVPDSMQPPGPIDISTRLESAGLTRGSQIVWRGSNVVVYEAVGPFIGQLSAPEPNGLIGLPVVYDLSPVSQRAGVYVDTTTNRVVRTYRYAIDSSGDETLIESLDILSIEKEN